MCGSIDKSPIKQNAAKNKFDTGDLFTNGETTKTKLHQVNLRSPLLRIHYYQNKWLQVKGIPIPNTNLQLNTYPNTKLDL